jgi:hypothetical protein
MDPNMTAQDELDALEERLDNPPLMWAPKGLPKDGDAEKFDTAIRVVGHVEERDTRDGDYGEYPWIVVLRMVGTRVAVAGFGTILKSRLAGVVVGDAVAIDYRGTLPSNTPGFKDFDNYEVVIRRNGKAVSSRLASETPDTDGDDLPLPDDDGK